MEWEDKKDISFLDKAYNNIIKANEFFNKSWEDKESQTFTYCLTFFMKIKRNLEAAIKAPDDQDRMLVLSDIEGDFRELNKFFEISNPQQQERYKRELNFILSYIPIEKGVSIVLQDIQEETINRILQSIGIKNHKPSINGYLNVIPERPTVGEIFTIELKLINSGRISAFDLDMELYFPKDIKVKEILEIKVKEIKPGPDPAILKTHKLSAQRIGRYKIYGRGIFKDVLGREWAFLIQPFSINIPFTKEEKKRKPVKSTEEAFERYLRGE